MLVSPEVLRLQIRPPLCWHQEAEPLWNDQAVTGLPHGWDQRPASSLPSFRHVKAQQELCSLHRGRRPWLIRPHSTLTSDLQPPKPRETNCPGARLPVLQHPELCQVRGPVAATY